MHLGLRFLAEVEVVYVRLFFFFVGQDRHILIQNPSESIGMNRFNLHLGKSPLPSTQQRCGSGGDACQARHTFTRGHPPAQTSCMSKRFHAHFVGTQCGPSSPPPPPIPIVRSTAAIMVMVNVVDIAETSSHTTRPTATNPRPPSPTNTSGDSLHGIVECG